jgi:SSS family solute:Na+ symporter
MNLLDWIVLTTYLVGLVGLSIYLGKGQTSQDDYYVGGRNISWWAIGISTMATQTSAISFISVPAFVAIKEGGGLTWLQYELALPLSMIAVVIFLIPFFRELNLLSVYEYLELRFGPSVRSLVSAIFLLSRGLATGVVVYSSGIVLSVALQLPLWSTILLIGVITIIYDTIGGISMVIYSDVIQMGVLVGGIILCLIYAADSVGSFGEMIAALPAERLTASDFSSGFGGNSAVPFWAFLFGGFFLYVAYYGTDQSQVQRELSSKSAHEVKKSLMFAGLARFPLTLMYVLMGIAALSVYNISPELAASVPSDKPDYLIPQYILHVLPSGLRAILFAALLAAAMSSLDSALNSLSAVTMRDFLNKWRPESAENLYLGKLTTVFWGILVTGFAFLVGNISETVIEAINKIGSAFYGPILAAFLVGILSKRVTTKGVITGIIAGVGFNIFLWMAHPEIHWMWWNPIGCTLGFSTAYLFSFTPFSEEVTANERYLLNFSKIIQREKGWGFNHLLLIVYFLLILSVVIWL